MRYWDEDDYLRNLFRPLPTPEKDTMGPIRGFGIADTMFRDIMDVTMPIQKDLRDHQMRMNGGFMGNM